MKIRDLGALEGEVLLFGGPYSNLHATNALVAQAARRGIPAQNCICTGDVVAYGADPCDTVEALRAFGCPVVAGNMEIQIGAGAADCGCGFADGTACDLMSGAWFAHAAAQITPDQRAWMAQCPDVIAFLHEGKRVAVIHGGVRDVARFIWPVSPEAVFAQEHALLEAAMGKVDMIVAGHCGVAFMRDFDFGTWLNAGVIGMPPHDGDARTAFAVLTANGPKMHRLDYDQDAACTAMEAAGLTQGYHRALVTGYWPSEDVLPSEMTLASRASG